MARIELPDCPGKRELIAYLNQKKKECEQKEWESGGPQGGTYEEDMWYAKGTVYREILEAIK